jgi:hypothetical protein
MVYDWKTPDPSGSFAVPTSAPVLALPAARLQACREPSAFDSQ